MFNNTTPDRNTGGQDLVLMFIGMDIHSKDDANKAMAEITEDIGGITARGGYCDQDDCGWITVTIRDDASFDDKLKDILDRKGRLGLISYSESFLHERNLKWLREQGAGEAHARPFYGR